MALFAGSLDVLAGESKDLPFGIVMRETGLLEVGLVVALLAFGVFKLSLMGVLVAVGASLAQTSIRNGRGRPRGLMAGYTLGLDVFAPKRELRVAIVI